MGSESYTYNQLQTVKSLPSTIAMDAINVFTCLALLLSLLYLTKLFSSNKKKRSNLPPSPPCVPILGHLHHLKKPLHQSLAALSSIHGPLLLLRFGSRPTLIVSSAPLAEECFTTNDLALANRLKLPSSRAVTYNYSAIGSTAYGPGWRELRRIAVVEVLSGHRLSFFTDVRAEEARALARRLFLDTASHRQEFKRVELRPRLFGLAMNVIMRMMAGKRYYGEDSGDGVAQHFAEIVEQTFALSGASNIGDFLPSAIGWFARLKVKAKLARIHSYRDRLIQAMIDERRTKRRTEEEEEASAHERIHQTVIDSLLSLQKSKPEQYTDLFIKILITSLLAAGIDTSSNTIEWAMSLLLNNPEKLEKLKQEIDGAVGNAGLLEESDLPKLPYLRSTINETLRLYPAGPLLVPHESLQECEVGGYDIPIGTIVLANVYAIHRDHKIWPEPAKFLPERFTEGVKAEGGRFFPFGMGRRRCPGEGLGMREVGLALGTLVQCFDWRRVGAEEVDMKEGSGLTLPREIPLQALCRPRQSMSLKLAQL